MIDQAQGLRRLASSAGARSRIDELLIDDRPARVSRRCVTVAITSGKGGVGKTNLSINLSLQLARLNKRVILFDADLGLANVNILLGLNPSFTLLDVVEGRAKMGDVLMKGPGNLSVVPGGSGVEKLANLDAVSLMRILRELSALEDSCDYLIFDTQAGISRSVRAFVNAAEKQIVVATPEPSSLADAYAALKMIVGTGGSDIGIAANMVRSEAEGLEVYNKLALLCRRFLSRTPHYLGALPTDPRLAAGVLRQAPVSLSQPHAPFSRAVARLALKVIGKPGRERNGFFDRLMSHFRTPEIPAGV